MTSWVSRQMVLDFLQRHTITDFDVVTDLQDVLDAQEDAESAIDTLDEVRGVLADENCFVADTPGGHVEQMLEEFERVANALQADKLTDALALAERAENFRQDVIVHLVETGWLTSGKDVDHDAMLGLLQFIVRPIQEEIR